MTEKVERPEDIFISLDDAHKNKRLSVERIYQRKTQLEHILLRPDTYVGSVEETTEQMYVYDKDKEAIIKKSVTYVPGLYKIFDEILVNAADNKQRDHRMNAVKVVIDPVQNEISVWNNGRGIPVAMHAVEKMYVPELIFGTLLTSSNYNDSQRKVTGGRNGYGAKLCNIFSSEFTVETSCSESKKSFKMTWTSNMGKSGKTIIKDSKGDFTKVTFKPDLSKFSMTHLTSDMVAIMSRRVYDLAGCIRGVSVYLNGSKIPLKTFKDYVELYVKGVTEDDDGEDLPRKVVHEIVNDRWEVAITASPSGFQQASFVNSIATTKGGTHVGYVVDQVVAKLLEVAKRKNKGGMDLKPMHVKSQVWVFVNCLIENPSFDSQTKENMTLKSKNFGSTCSLSDKFIKGATSCGVIERVLNWARAKSQAQISKKQSGSKHSKLRGIAKLDDANEAGGKNSLGCTLIITEGDSAKSLAISGLGVIGRDNYGVFPLRGKLLNVREATHNQIMGNEEIKNLVKILGLNYGKKYEDGAELRTLRYGHLMIMADQDQDGSHIKGLVINFISHNWPHLLRHNFMEEFITPIIKVTKGQQEIPFFSLPEFERWKENTDNAHTWRTKYYKGLGTSTAKEAKEYFSDMDRHRIPFEYGGPGDDDAINLAFSKKLADRRKEWLTAWLTAKKDKRSSGMNESFLYGEQTRSITYSDFINKELILFSNADNERSIPSMVDGLKPGQRKVLFTCFKRNDKRDVKVAQLAGSVAEHSAYHHGEASLMSTIINLAQNFVGSNNMNLLQPIGQFGTRLHGGKDAASPRYIFTKLSPLARLVFPKTDDTQLKYLYDDSMRIEPEWYMPILPMVLVNGSEGIGTGYSTTVPNYNVRDIITNLKRLMNGMDPLDMVPSYKNFTGGIYHTEPTKYYVHGTVARLSDTSIEITELPIRTWTQAYKEHVLEVMLHGSEKVQPFITDYKEYHTDTTVRFVVNVTAAKMEEAAVVGLYKKFKMESSISTANMVLFDKDGCLRKYATAIDVLIEFYDIRLVMYQKRKDYLVGMLSAEASKLTNQARLIMEKIEGKIVIENKKKSVLCNELKAAGYRSDPIKAWKASLAKQEDVDHHEEEEEEEGEEEATVEGSDFMYLLSMNLLSLTKEKKDALLKERDAKVEELRIIQEKTPKGLWKEDIDMFMEELDRVEEKERQDEQAGAAISVKKSNKGGKGPKGPTRQTKLVTGSKNNLKDTKPSAFGEAIQPVVPEFNANPTKVKEKKEKKEKELPKGQTTLNLKKKRSFDDMFGESDGEEEMAAENTPEVAADKSADVADVSASSRNGGQQTEQAPKPPPPKKAKTSTESKPVKATKPAPKKKTAPPKKKQVSSESDGSDSDALTTVKQAKKKPQKRKAVCIDSDDSDFEMTSTSKPKPKPKNQPKKKVISVDSDASDVEASIAKKKKPVEKKKKIVVKITSDDESGFGSISRKKAPPKKKGPGRKRLSSDESDWDGDNVVGSDNDESVRAPRAPASRGPGSRAMRERKRVVYAIDDDDEEEEKEDEEDFI